MEKTMSNTDAVQHGGDHYKNGYQHWNLLPDLLFGPEYYIGCATKYVTRHEKKNGREDILKAIHFTEKLIELCEQGVLYPRQWPESMRPAALAHLSQYALANGLDENSMEIKAIMYLTIGTTIPHYQRALGHMSDLLDDYKAHEKWMHEHPPLPDPSPKVNTPLSHGMIDLDDPATAAAKAASALYGLPPAAYTAINNQFGAEGYWGDAQILWKCKACKVYFKNTDGTPPWESHQCAPQPDGSEPTSAYVDQDHK
jgi:hypothetical protein